MAKIIRFDLPINGIKVKALEELRDNLTDEIVSISRSGQLVRWLSSRNAKDEADKVSSAVARELGDADLFREVCEAIGVEAHSEDVDALFGDCKPAGKIFPPKSTLDKLNGMREVCRRALNLLPIIRQSEPYDGQEVADAEFCNIFLDFQRLDGLDLKSCQLVDKNFAWVPEILVSENEFIGDGKILAKARNSKLEAPCSGVVRVLYTVENYVFIIISS